MKFITFENKIVNKVQIQAIMKVAILIAVHKYPIQVKRLIEAFQSDQFTFFIHVDKKTDISPFRKLITGENIIFINNRTKVEWAGFSQVEATQTCMKEIVAFDNFDYITFISGQDFPIKKPAYFQNFLIQNPNKEFVSCVPFDLGNEWWRRNKNRVLKFNFNNWKIPGKYKIQFLFNCLKAERKPPKPYVISGNSNWFCVSMKCARYIIEKIDQEKALLDFFKYVWGADEMVIPTILYNSPFKGNLTSPIVYVEWSKINDGHPETLKIKDLDKILSSEKIFARKFDMAVDNEVISYLEKHLINNKLDSISVK